MSWYTLLLAACLVLIVVPPIFIYNQIYHDGICGRAGLLAISLSAAFVWLLHMFAEPADSVPLALFALQSSAFTVFLVWHLFRFHTRVVRERRRAAPDPEATHPEAGHAAH